MITTAETELTIVAGVPPADRQLGVDPTDECKQSQRRKDSRHNDQDVSEIGRADQIGRHA